MEKIAQVGNEKCGYMVVKHCNHYRIYFASKLEDCTPQNFITSSFSKEKIIEWMDKLFTNAVQTYTRSFLDDLQQHFLTIDELKQKINEYFGTQIVVNDKTYYDDDEYDTYTLVFNVYEEDKPMFAEMCGEFDINYAKLRHDKIYIISSDINFNISSDINFNC